jgi:Skp family chaperone for outer membrane proteins
LRRGIFFLPRQFKSVLAFREVFLYNSQPNNFEQQLQKKRKSIEKKLLKEILRMKLLNFI